MDANNANYFVISATVSAELYKAMRVAKDIALTASNARALALRAGQSAAGFRAITDFIDQLATVTVKSSNTINQLACQLSRLAVESVRANEALTRFGIVQRKASSAIHIQSLDPALRQTQAEKTVLQREFDHQVYLLQAELETIAKELRTATVLSAMSRIEASQTSAEFSEQLDVVASNVAAAAISIQRHVQRSQALFSNFTRN